MKILFCNIAWMKYYHGVKSDDKPINGGKYIKQNTDGGEVYNFMQFNRCYYGFVRSVGDIHIERLDGVNDNEAATSGVLVVWISSNPKTTGVYIVGWYKNATVYRSIQEIMTTPGKFYNYNIVCNVKDGVLIDYNKRTFEIPLALKNGKGKGKGQSNVWYAEDAEIRRNYIPKVIDYINSWPEPSIDITYTSDELFENHPDIIDMSTHEMIKNIDYQINDYDYLRFQNSLCSIDPLVENLIERAQTLWDMGYCDEAVKDLLITQQKYKDNLYIEKLLADLYFVLEKYDQAIDRYVLVLRGLVDNENSITYWQNNCDIITLRQILMFNLAHIFMIKEDNENEEFYLKMIIALSPESECAKLATNELNLIKHNA